MRTLGWLSLVVGLLLGLFGSQAWAVGLPEPPSLRLAPDPRPLGYTVELVVDPKQETFTGTIDIELEAKTTHEVVWLHADDLTVEKASQVGGADAKIVGTKQGLVGLAFSPSLPAGRATLRLVYRGVLSSKDSAGASRQKEGDDWYVFTHFEPIDARRVFPCFDEPSFKVPWQLAITVPADQLALSNTPTTAVTEVMRNQQKWKRFAFARTKPLPSYLIAFAVGAFELVEAGKSPRSGVPIRIITPRGQAAQARWAAESTRQVLGLLEEYFGSNYPYEKVDMIAVPLFSGAMENPGLITFSSQLMLRRPAEETVDSRRAYASVATHELAHQWFGDLVTMAWWDDLWLNEAFASWMTPKIIERWQPGWGAAEGRVGMRAGAMATDKLLAARRIRQPIESNNDIKNAFDPITYNKGASVIHMFEEWVGPSVLQAGVRAYLKKHAHGNATSADFLSAVSLAAKRDVKTPFSTFLDQAGVPALSMDVHCDGKTARLKLHQERYLPIGVVAPAAQTWQLPICVRGTTRVCTLLTTTDGELALPGACPKSLLPNVGAAGYYRAVLSPTQLAALLADGGSSLSVPELLGVLSDVSAMVRAGKLPYGDALALVPRFSGHANRHVVQAAVQLLGNARDNGYFPDAERPAWVRFIQQNFGARARQLGWLPRSSDDEDTRILRNVLVPLVADDGQDAALETEAAKLATAWMADHSTVPAESVPGILDAAAQRKDGAAARYEAWLTAAKGEKDQLTRVRLLHALSGYRDPAFVARSFALILEKTFDIRESLTLLFGATRTPRTRRQAWDFLRAQFDPLVAKLPRDMGAMLPNLASSLCDDAVATEAEAFFKDRAPRFVGGPRQLALALENTRQCAAFKRAQSPSVTSFLTSLPR